MANRISNAMPGALSDMNPDPHPIIRVTTIMLAALALSACSILGGPDPGQSATRYAPDPRIQPDPAWPQADWQLSLAEPEVAAGIDSQRILVRLQPNEVQIYQGARWAKLPSDQVLDGVLRALEDSGRISAVARQASGIGAEYKLVMDLRRFESEYAADAILPTAVVEVSAKLLHVRDQQIAASRVFLQSVPAASTAVPDVITAFEQALATNSREMAGWILESGNAHERSAHP